MSLTQQHLTLTHQGALAVLNAAVTRAADTQAPQCIAVVDTGANLLAFVRMDGAKLVSVDSAMAKAITAATSGKATGQGSVEQEIKMAVVTHGRVTNIRGGVPLLVDGKVVGGIGVGSGTLDQDVDCAEAGAAALNA